MIKNALMAAGVIMSVAGAGEAQAALKSVTFDQLYATKDVGAVNDYDSVLVIGKINKGAGAVSNTTKLVAWTTKLALTAAWAVGTDFRLVGVNIDVVDGAGKVVASDTFAGLQGGFATSTFNVTGLKLGKPYKIVLKGTAEAIASYLITVTPSN